MENGPPPPTQFSCDKNILFSTLKVLPQLPCSRHRLRRMALPADWRIPTRISGAVVVKITSTKGRN